MPTGRPLGAVILAAGLGTRMRSARAKVLHELGGRPLVRYPLDALATLAPDRVALVVGHQADAVQGAAAGGAPAARPGGVVPAPPPARPAGARVGPAAARVAGAVA